MMEPFPRVYSRVLENSDTEGRWYEYEVYESPYDALEPKYEVDGGRIVVYLPAEYRTFTNGLIRSCMDWIVDYAYTGVRKPLPGRIMNHIRKPAYMDARRAVLLSELHIKETKVPDEFNEAMMIQPGLRKSLDSMAFAYYDNGDYISTTDYLSRTFIMPPRLFECPSKRMRVYVVFREMALANCIHLKGPYGVHPNVEEAKEVFMYRFPDWEECESKAKEWGWKFRYEMGEDDDEDEHQDV